MSYNNKIIYGGQVLIDLTSDTATAAQVAKGYTFHDMTGAPVTGTNTFDSDTSNATAKVGEILSGQTAYARGALLTGTMPNRGSFKDSIASKNQQITIPQGYHDGSGKISISTDEQAKLIGTNIRNGVTILGVEGTMEEDSEVSELNKEVTPTSSDQLVTPSTGFTCFRQITVKAIPYSAELNSANGYTITIG